MILFPFTNFWSVPVEDRTDNGLGSITEVRRNGLVKLEGTDSVSCKEVDFWKNRIIHRKCLGWTWRGSKCVPTLNQTNEGWIVNRLFIPPFIEPLSPSSIYTDLPTSHPPLVQEPRWTPLPLLLLLFHGFRWNWTKTLNRRKNFQFNIKCKTGTRQETDPLG